MGSALRAVNVLCRAKLYIRWKEFKETTASDTIQFASYRILWSSKSLYKYTQIEGFRNLRRLAKTQSKHLVSTECLFTN